MKTSSQTRLQNAERDELIKENVTTLQTPSSRPITHLRKETGMQAYINLWDRVQRDVLYN